MQLRKFVTLSLSHFFVDAYASIFSAIAVVIAPAQIGVFATISSVSSSFTQLWFGYLSDRGALLRMVIGGIAASAVFLSCLGWFLDAPVLFAATLILGGCGIAAFHPGAVVLAAQTAGQHRGVGVSVFLMTGTFGFALGPIFIERYVRRGSHVDLPLLAIPGACIALAAWWFLRGAAVPKRPTTSTAKLPAIRGFLSKYGWSILPIYLLVVMRNMQQVTLVSFLQNMMVGSGHSAEDAARTHTCFIFGGAVGMLVVGVLMASYSRRLIQMVSLVGGVACTMAFLLFVEDLSLPVAMPLLAAAGFLSLSTNSMHIVMGQEIAPQHASTVSSLMMGFGWGVGAVGPLMVSALSVWMKLSEALAVVAALPILMVPLVFYLQARPTPAELAVDDDARQERQSA